MFHAAHAFKPVAFPHSDRLLAIAVRVPHEEADDQAGGQCEAEEEAHH